MYLYDYHIHSINSSDGRNTVSELCVDAIASGMKEIAVTDHFEPSFGNEAYPYYNVGNYFFDIMRVKAIFRNELKIKSAVELGQPHLFPEYSQKLIDSNAYDYVLGSAHKMKEGKDFGDIAYSRENIAEYCNKYLDELKSLVEWNKFDCVGHIDLIKRYASRFKIKADLMSYRERLELVLKKVITNGKGIEVNTSGLRQSAGECLPGFSIIRLYRQLGGEIITVGSDAHTARDVGSGIMDAVELISLAGFRYMTVYTARQPSMIKIADSTPVYRVGKKSA